MKLKKSVKNSLLSLIMVDVPFNNTLTVPSWLSKLIPLLKLSCRREIATFSRTSPSIQILDLCPELTDGIHYHPSRSRNTTKTSTISRRPWIQLGYLVKKTRRFLLPIIFCCGERVEKFRFVRASIISIKGSIS